MRELSNHLGNVLAKVRDTLKCSSMNMKSKLAFGVLFCLCFYFVADYSSRKYREGIMNKPKKYCYEIRHDAVNAALFVKEEEDIEKMISFYDSISLGYNPYIRFPVRTMPTDTCVYVLESLLDGKITKVACYGAGATFQDYMTGYVMTDFLHDNK